VLITNALRRAPATLIGRYAERMIIENGIADEHLPCVVQSFHVKSEITSVPRWRHSLTVGGEVSLKFVDTPYVIPGMLP
jgi:hypothetical protein